MAGASLPATALVALVAVPMLAGSAVAQDAGEILDRALEAYEARAEGIDNYTVVQEVMGMTTTEYFVKQEVGGHQVFVPSSADEDTLMGADRYQSPAAMLTQIRERAELEGRETVEGQETHVLTVRDFEGLEMWSGGLPGMEEDEGDLRPTLLRLYLDTDDYVPRRMVMQGEIARGDSTSEVTLTATMTDYREVEGLLHPFRMQMQISGIAAGISPEQMEQARQAKAQLEEQLESMPEAQREQMKSMLGPQLEKLEKMLSSGSIEVDVVVKELRVNSGPPAS